MNFNDKLKKGLISGISFIIIALLIGIIFLHDIAFIFAGIGTIIIGITFLTYINRDGK